MSMSTITTGRIVEPELRFTTNTDDDQNLYFVESDDYLGIALRRYF